MPASSLYPQDHARHIILLWRIALESGNLCQQVVDGGLGADAPKLLPSAIGAGEYTAILLRAESDQNCLSQDAE